LEINLVSVVGVAYPATPKPQLIFFKYFNVLDHNVGALDSKNPNERRHLFERLGRDMSHRLPIRGYKQETIGVPQEAIVNCRCQRFINPLISAQFFGSFIATF
jgi:hypothetical protein